MKLWKCEPSVATVPAVGCSRPELAVDMLLSDLR